MSRLAALLKAKSAPPATHATSATSPPAAAGQAPEVAEVATVAASQSQKSDAAADQLTPERTKAYQHVLRELEANPAVARTFSTRWESDVLIVTLAVRGVGMCELQISAERFSGSRLDDYESLAVCVANVDTVN